MNFSVDANKMLGSMSQGVTNTPIIIGLPSVQALVPNFCIGVTTEEDAQTSSTLPGMQLTAGDLFLKSARNSGRYTFKLIISETPNVKSDKIRQIQMAMQQISTIASSLAFYGGVMPAISGLANITKNYAVAQINALNAMKDGFQPIILLNLYMPLQAFSTNNPFLISNWYIESLDFKKEESERGLIATITLRELLQKRTIFATVTNILTNLANTLLGSSAGKSIGSKL